MNALILGRWVMDASIIEEDVRSELPVVTRSSIVTIATMQRQYSFHSMLRNPFDRHKLIRQDVKQFEMTATEVLVSLRSRVGGERGEMEEPKTGEVQILLTSYEDSVSMRSLGVGTIYIKAG